MLTPWWVGCMPVQIAHGPLAWMAEHMTYSDSQMTQHISEDCQHHLRPSEVSVADATVPEPRLSVMTMHDAVPVKVVCWEKRSSAHCRSHHHRSALKKASYSSHPTSATPQAAPHAYQTTSQYHAHSPTSGCPVPRPCRPHYPSTPQRRADTWPAQSPRSGPPSCR